MLWHSLVSLDLNIFTVVLVTVSVLSLFQLSNTLVEKKLRRGPEVCCTWNLYGWPRVCVARDGLNIGLLHIGHVLLMLTVSNPCVILNSRITSVLSRHVLYSKVCCMIDACLMIVRNVYVHIMSFVIILLGSDFSIYVGHE